MKLGFIGLGIMGESMAENLVKKSGEQVYVYDFVEEKVKQLQQAGAIACSSSEEVALQADVIFTSVPKADHVKAVHESIYPVLKKNQIFIDMSTIAPNDSIALAKEIKQRGGIMLDAPLVKSKQAAIDGTLGIYVGGQEETYVKVRDYLLCIGNNIVYMGENGAGLKMKICHNMLVGEIQNGVNEMMSFANSLGIEWEKFQDAIRIGGAKNAYLETKAKAIGLQDYTTAFSIENMYKDVSIAKQMLEELEYDLPGTRLVWNIYDEAMKEGYGKEDFSATFKIVSKRLQ